MSREGRILKPGTEDVKEMVSLSCCWPPGTQGMEWPEPQQ